MALGMRSDPIWEVHLLNAKLCNDFAPGGETFDRGGGVKLIMIIFTILSVFVCCLVHDHYD